MFAAANKVSASRENKGALVLVGGGTSSASVVEVDFWDLFGLFVAGRLAVGLAVVEVVTWTLGFFGSRFWGATTTI
jgi:hypothetical protein